MGDRPSLIDRIEALVEQPSEGSPDVLLEAMEHTLTDGYAEALAIEGERLRTEREIAAGLAEAGGEAGALDGSDEDFGSGRGSGGGGGGDEGREK